MKSIFRSTILQCKAKLLSKIQVSSVYDIIKPAFLCSMLLGFTPIAVTTKKIETNRWTLLWCCIISGFCITFAIAHLHYLHHVLPKTETYRTVLYILQYISILYVLLAMVTDIKFSYKVTINTTVDLMHLFQYSILSDHRFIGKTKQSLRNGYSKIPW